MTSGPQMSSRKPTAAQSTFGFPDGSVSPPGSTLVASVAFGRARERSNNSLFRLLPPKVSITSTRRLHPHLRHPSAHPPVGTTSTSSRLFSATLPPAAPAPTQPATLNPKLEAHPPLPPLSVSILSNFLPARKCRKTFISGPYLLILSRVGKNIFTSKILHLSNFSPKQPSSSGLESGAWAMASSCGFRPWSFPYSPILRGLRPQKYFHFFRGVCP